MRRLREMRSSAGEKGYVVALTALMLLPLIAFTGFAVDLGSWISRANQLQAAADAAALAGVVYLPEEQRATDAALDHLATNGFVDGDGITVTIDADLDRETLRVAVRDNDVDRYFSSVFLDDAVSIERSAVSQFVETTPMGTPEPQLGIDPERGHNPEFVLNIAGYGTKKENGDKRAAGSCENSYTNCPGNGRLDFNNADYSEHGYFFSVNVSEEQAATGDLSIEIFNPTFVQVGDFCNQNLPNAGQRNNLHANFFSGDPYGNSRYEDQPDSLFCTGDHRIDGQGQFNTTYIVRAPDDTPFNHLDNEPICAQTFSPYNTNINNALQNTNPQGLEEMPFYEHFRRWVPICTVPQSQVQAGEYIVQIRTNADVSNVNNVTTATPGGNFGTVLQRESSPNPSTASAGHNRFNIRASWGAAPTVNDSHDNPVRPESGPGAFDGSGLSINALGHLPIYQQQEAATGEFHLARVTPTNAGRALVLTFWDVGDVAAAESSTVEILPPAEVQGQWDPDCTFTVVTDAEGPHEPPTTPQGCRLPGLTFQQYNGKDVVARIPIPENYSCDSEDPEGCWFMVNVTIEGTGNPNDTTTWSARMQGDPVRLIE